MLSHWCFESDAVADLGLQVPAPKSGNDPEQGYGGAFLSFQPTALIEAEVLPSL